MAILQKLDKSFIGSGLYAPNVFPAELIDPIESNGSLLLFDASKYIGGLGNNSVIPNLFDENAIKITGESSPMRLIVEQGVPNRFVMERSDKGGIHFVPNANLDYGELDDYYATLSGTGGVKRYMKEHALVSDSPHQFYISFWHRFTTANQIYQELINAPYEISHYISNYTYDWNYNNEHVYYKIIEGERSVGNYHDYAVSKIVNEPGITAPKDSTNFNLFNFGPSGSNGFGYQAKKYGASIIYRAYVEDLTISGRTSQEVLALDSELYSNAFAEGGKFYNDTWTNPTTAFTV